MFELLIQIWQYGPDDHKPNTFLFACHQMCEDTPEQLVLFPTLAACNKERESGIEYFSNEARLARGHKSPGYVKAFRLTCRPHKHEARIG